MTSLFNRASRISTEILFTKQPSKPATVHASRAQLKKRHWVLGSFVIFVGSWITHTTTATLADENTLSVPIADPAYNFTGQPLPFYSAAENSTTAPLNFVAPSKFEADKISLMEVPLEQNQPAAQETFKTISHKIKRGESLGIIFRKYSLNSAIPQFISEHDQAKQLVSISVGKTLELKLDDQQQLREIHYPVNALQKFVVKLKGIFIASAKTQDLPYQIEQKTVSAEITSSLYETALKSGISQNTILEMIRIFGWDVDFVQDIHVGDTFHVIHTDYHIDGKKVADGDILAAEFNTQGQRYRAIRFEDENGNPNYYSPEGDSMLGTFLRSPVEFSRISSRFGKRKHPISKKWKTHKGVDYAASRGTPIRATADGTVVHRGRKGGYGKTIVLRHAGRFTTLYAHMNDYAKGVKSGTRVKQGQTIGYVGSTGYSTGPHVHYEFRVNGVHRNSLTYKTPKASSVKPGLKVEFEKVASNWIEKLNSVQRNYMLAKTSGRTDQI